MIYVLYLSAESICWQIFYFINIFDVRQTISEKEAAAEFDILEDKRCQNFIGGYSCYENLEFLKGRPNVFPNELKATDRDILFEGLDGILSEVFLEQIWNMIYERYQILQEKWMKG
ncbi:MAG: hypothetical protein PUC55_00830 [Lachnospiraceae bacterium]|nr:hypothetical protein [Lachnospiraceae bacterium]